MASLRTSLLGQTAASARPLRQLERQFALMRVAGNVTAHHSNRRAISQTRRNDSRLDDLEDSGLLGSNEILPAEDILALNPSAGLNPAGIESEGGSGSAGGSRDKKWSEKKQLTASGYPILEGSVRAVPASPSYFSPQPNFTDTYLQLHNVFRKYGHLPTAPPDQVPRVVWLKLRDFRLTVGERVTEPQFNKCLAIIKRLHKIHPALKPPAVLEALDGFTRLVNPLENSSKPLTIDRFGRAIGVGRRKTSTARAWVVEGTGEVLVNGKTLSEAFGRVHDRESATWALRATERMDKYNVWALVSGGGTTGQAEALTMAVAKGLIAHEPALKTALRKSGCITRDPRKVERKKHGHLKARKSPTWVKR